MLRINVGCGKNLVPGWRNFDNSFSLKLARWPFFVLFILRKCRFFNETQYEFMQFARNSSIEYGDAVKRLPLVDGEVDVLYSSHMLEHLDRIVANIQSYRSQTSSFQSPTNHVLLSLTCSYSFNATRSFRVLVHPH